MTAGVPGYTVAGKTGTAQIPDPVPRRATSPVPTWPPSPGSPRPRTPRCRPSWCSTSPRRSTAASWPRRCSPRSCGTRCTGTASRRRRVAGRRGAPLWPCRFPRSRRQDGRRQRPEPHHHDDYDRRFPREDHGRAVTAPAGPPLCAWTGCSRRSRSSRAYGDPAADRGHVHRVRQPTRRARGAVLLPSRPSRMTATTTPPKPCARGATALLVERRLALDVTQAVVAPGDRPPVPWPAWRAPSSDNPARSLAHRGRHRDQRQDDGHPPAGLDLRGRTDGRRTVIGTLRRRPHDARGTACCSVCWPRRATTAVGPWRWRCRRTRSPRPGSTGSASTPPCSPTCRTTISTTTAPWTRTSPPRRRCSPPSAPRWPS